MGVANNRTAWQSVRTAKQYDRRRFTSLAGRIFDSLEKSVLSRFLEQIERHQPIKTVLDVPCGTGRISELLLARGYDVVGGDISEEMMDVARNKFETHGYKQFKLDKMDIFNLAQADGSFDCVTCIRLFQHYSSGERIKALTELGRVSKRYVIANVTYVNPYYSMLRKVRQLLNRYAPSHTMNWAEMNHELSTAGLRLVDSRFPQPGYNSNRVLLMEKV